MTNEEIIEKLGYTKIFLRLESSDFKKIEAIDNAVDIIHGLDGLLEDFKNYKKQLENDNPKGSSNYFIVTNMIYEFEHMLEQNFGKFEDWHSSK